jgi:hypothetical protein
MTERDAALITARLGRFGFDEAARAAIEAGMSLADVSPMVPFAAAALEAARAANAREADRNLSVLASDGTLPDQVYEAIRTVVLRALTVALEVPRHSKPH